jgi:peptide chain release factor 2
MRSYVLHPYTMAKDLHTGAETDDVYGVLDGDLTVFMVPAVGGQEQKQ